MLKISDFGLGDLLEGSRPATLEHLLYRAPELLRLKERAPAHGSQRGDVYSFAIILYEIHGRRGPFGALGMASEGVLERVSSPGGALLRPLLDRLENCMDVVKETMTACWSEAPDTRWNHRYTFT